MHPLNIHSFYLLHLRTPTHDTQVREFRRTHEKLRQVIERVIAPKMGHGGGRWKKAAGRAAMLRRIGGGAGGETKGEDGVALAGGEDEEDEEGEEEGEGGDPQEKTALKDINTAYQHFLSINVLLTDDTGNTAWEMAKKSYEVSVDRVETQIIQKLTDRLGRARTADEMFRVFSKFNELFFRSRIKGAIQQFQTQLIGTVKKDIQALQTKFKRQYHNSEARHMSQVRDLPPISGAIIWAKQIERQLKTYMQRIEAVLGRDWQQHVEGKQLKQEGDAFLRKLDTQQIFDNWLARIRDHHANFEVAGNCLVVEPAAVGSSRLRLRVSFDPEIITLFKEVRNLQWLSQEHTGFRVPYTLKIVSDEAKEKYPQAMALQATLRTYMQSVAKIDVHVAPLLAEHKRAVQNQIYKAFQNQVKWESESLDTFVKELSERVYVIQDKVQDALTKHKDIAKHLRELGECAYTPDAFRGVMLEMQAKVDDMNLAEYSNLGQWTAGLNTQIEATLVQRLAAALRQWTKIVGSNNGGKGGASPSSPSQQLAYASGGGEYKGGDGGIESNLHHMVGGGGGRDAELKVGLDESRHEVELRNTMLALGPPLARGRVHLIEQLRLCMATACDQPRIISSKYDNAFGADVSAGGSPAGKAALGDGAGGAGDGSGGAGSKAFHALVDQLPVGLLSSAYAAVEQSLGRAKAYTRTWLQYQSLWDMDASQLFDPLGEDLEKWQTVLREIKSARGTLESSEQEQRFGLVVIDRQQVQSKVSNKYNEWHKEAQARFKTLLGEAIVAFHETLKTTVTKLELANLDGGTAEVVEYVSLVQEMVHGKEALQKSMDTFSVSERLLTKQRFRFPTDWLAMENVEGTWSAFEQILGKRAKVMEGEIPALQRRIETEGAAIDRKVRQLTDEWQNERPLDKDTAPTEALEALASFEKRISDLRTGYDRVARAKAALGLDLYAEDVLEPLTKEMGQLKEVWGGLASVYEEIHELGETLWTALVPRKVRGRIEAILESWRNLPDRVRQYDAATSLRNRLELYQRSNALISDLKTDALKERHWKDIYRVLQLVVPQSQLSLNNLWQADLKKKETALREVLSAATGEMALEEFLRELSDYWDNLELDLVNYQDKCRLIRGWDELFLKLDEHTNQLLSMRQSPFFKVFEGKATEYEGKLEELHEILDQWIDVQRRWVYLEGIFYGSQDIKIQLKAEFNRFKGIDSDFIAIMRRVGRNPKVMDVIGMDADDPKNSLLKKLERLADLLTNVQKALGEYLERQRAAFPRFYFVGDEDLLEIIGNTKDPVKIQRHMAKMFAGIVSLDMQPVHAALESKGGAEGQGEAKNPMGASGGAVEVMMKAMCSREGEVVQFLEPVTPTGKKIHEWLAGVEGQMRQSLASLLERSLRGLSSLYPGGQVDGPAFLEWIHASPAQIIILGTQVHWSSQVESSLKAGDTAAAAAAALEEPLLCAVGALSLLADQVLGNVGGDRRKKYEQLITELVHQRDATRQLMKKKVCDAGKHSHPHPHSHSHPHSQSPPHSV